MRPARIAIFNLNDTRRDPRVRRTTKSLQRAGHQVRVFELGGIGRPAAETIDGFDVERVLEPPDYSDERMAEVAAASPRTGRILRACNHAVTGPWSLRLHRLVASAQDKLSRRSALFRNQGRWTNDPASDPEIMRIRSVILINLNLFRAASAFAPEIVYANDLDTLIAAHMLHATRGVPIVYDAHEVYPEQFAIGDRSETWHSFYTKLEKQLIGAALGRLTVCDSIAEYFAAAYGAPGFVTILNTPSLNHLPPESILDRRNATPKLIYHGSYAAFRGLDEIVNAAARIEGAQVVFRGIGAYETVLREQVERIGVGGKVSFEPPVAVTELVESASVCDIGLNPFVNVCKNSEFAMPNKFFEYMMAGLALMSSDLVEMRRLTDRLRVGRIFPDLSPRSVADSLNALVADRDAIQTFRSNAYFAARDRYNWETEEQLFLQNFDRFMSPAL